MIAAGMCPIPHNPTYDTQQYLLKQVTDQLLNKTHGGNALT
jgi:hypothetical protein